MFHNDNAGSELAIGLNSTKLSDSLLKAKFFNFQTR